MKEIIYDDRLNKEIGEYNYEVGKKHFSYTVLQEKLEELLHKVSTQSDSKVH